MMWPFAFSVASWHCVDEDWDLEDSLEVYVETQGDGPYRAWLL